MDDVRARLADIAGSVWKPDPVNGPRVQVRLLTNPDAAAMHAALVALVDLADAYAFRAAERRATVPEGDWLTEDEAHAAYTSAALDAAASAIRGTVEDALSREGTAL